MQQDETFIALLENRLDMTAYNLRFAGMGPYENINISSDSV